MARFVHRETFERLEPIIQIRVPEIRNLTEDTSRVPPLPSPHTGQLINGIGEGGCAKGRCGAEAACRSLPNRRYQCVCPHDNSPPTSDLRCPNRLTVPITPKPIHNIIPPAGSNETSNGTLIVTSSQRSLLIEEKHLDVGVLAGAASATIILFSIFIFLVIQLKRRTCTKTVGIESEKSNPYSPSPLKKSLLLSDRYTVNTQYTPCVALTVPLLQSDTLTFQHEIGEGCFGKVFRGELKKDGTETVETVAIKVLKDTANKKAEEDFMREVDVMSAFRHDNILTLIGVVLKEQGMSPMMVFEYMEHGDLAEVLRQNSRPFGTHSSVRSRRAATFGTLLDGRALLNIALQLASGMKYLASQRFVHRDLACRNCLVGKGLVVKIADFGMSRDVYTCDYYKIGGSRLLPVRWMAPESVLYGKFTLESDIWSYGVVLWEIYSYGKQPYFGHTNEEVLQLIMQGTMLTIPDSCPPFITKLIKSCWKTESRDRIPFVNIYDELESALAMFDSDDHLIDEIREKTKVKLPRPPVKPISHLGDLLDAEGYLLPQEGNKVNYLQTLADVV